MPVESSTDSSATALPRHWFVQNVLPFLTSLAFHAGLLLIGLVMYQSVKTLMRPAVPVAVTPMPPVEQAISSALQDGFVGTENNPLKQPIQNLVDETSTTGWTNVRGTGTKNTTDSFNSTSEDPAARDQFIGVGPGGRTGKGRPGSGDGDPGPLGAFGDPQRGGGSNIFNPGAGPSAHSVVFLCDASGSMLTKFDALRGALDKAVLGLKPTQWFGVTFFGDNRLDTMNHQLLMANPETKAHAINFLENVTPRGTTDPLPGIELAFKQKPQLIFLLTDGDFPDNEVVLNQIRELNRDHSVKINTIAFVGEGDTDTAFISLLKQIASENAGSYRHVTQDQLP